VWRVWQEVAVNLDLDVIELGDCTVLRVTGEVDLHTAPRLRQQLVDLMDDGKLELVVDLTPTEFLDSTGIGTLVAILKSVRTRGGDLALVCPAGHIRRVLELVGLHLAFRIYDSLDDIRPSTQTGTD
jgi:anti-sigma B factor antagonist